MSAAIVIPTARGGQGVPRTAASGGGSEARSTTPTGDTKGSSTASDSTNGSDTPSSWGSGAERVDSSGPGSAGITHRKFFACHLTPAQTTAGRPLTSAELDVFLENLETITTTLDGAYEPATNDKDQQISFYEGADEAPPAMEDDDVSFILAAFTSLAGIERDHGRC